MSFLARLSLAHRGLVALMAAVVTGFGVFAIPALKQQLLPSLEFPAAVIVASYPGAGPEIVERQVTEPIERGLQGIEGLDTVRSTSREGSATIRLELAYGTDLDATVGRVRTALSGIESQLPDGVEPDVFAGSTDDLPAVVLAASGPGDERGFADRLRRVVVPELQGIDGVREATVTGDRADLVVIEPDPARLAAARLDVAALGAALRASGVAIPAGAVTENGRTLNVQVGTPSTSLEDLRDLYLAPSASAKGAAPVRLGDVATISRRPAPPTTLTRTNGSPSLGISVTARPDGNAVQISHDVRDRLGPLASALGGGAELTVVFDQAPYVEKSIHGLTTEGLLGLLMAVLVILAFLLSVRSTLVTAVSIPLSVLVALIALWTGDLSLNLLTLGALTIAVGRVVDDSIVVLENIKRHLGYGEDRRDAIVTAVREVAGAVTASTLTTVMVFAPIALVGGFVGQLFTPFAITVTVALAASLLVSLTVVPVLAYWFLRPAGWVGAGPAGWVGAGPAAGGPGVEADRAAVRAAAERRELRSPLQRAYLPVIGFATRRRLATVLLGVLVFAVTVGLAGRLETNFFDESGADTLTISQELPPGTSLDNVDAAARRVEDVLAGLDDVEAYQVSVGGRRGLFGIGGGAAAQATFSVALADGTDAAAARDAIRRRLAGLGGVGEVTVGTGGGGGPAANELQVVVHAADADTLARAAEQVRGAVAGTPDVADVTSDATRTVPRYDVAVDRGAAAEHGLTEAAIGQLVAQAFRGAPLGQVSLDGAPHDVVLRAGEAPADIEELRALSLPGGVTLDEVADVNQVAGPVQVTRIDGERSVTVSGTATGSDVGATTQALTKRLAALSLPAGASYQVGGVSAEQRDAFADLGVAVLAAIAIVFLIMAATFRSLVQPLILLVSVPFAATGAIGLLLATGTPLGVPALVGVLMLVGIVVTNAIVLLDLINQYRAQGMGVQEAVIEGGRRRLRPILMTAVATICALLPMAFGLTGEGGFIGRPLAIVVIGGLLSSTLLTLVLVPTLYTMVEHAKERYRARWAARAARRAGVPPADPGAPAATAVGVPSGRSSADAGLSSAGDGPSPAGAGPSPAGARPSSAGAAGGTPAGASGPRGSQSGGAGRPAPNSGGAKRSAPVGEEERPVPATAIFSKTDQFEIVRRRRKE
jgi:HAE1 family hydrophobic/amphiphilic exporter-1